MKAIHDLVELGKERGYVTHDELDEVLPSEGTDRRSMAGLIEDMDIEVLANEPVVDFQEDEVADDEEADDSSTRVEQYDFEGADSSDPIKVYFREMSQKGLLDREGEVLAVDAQPDGHPAGPDNLAFALCWSGQRRRGCHRAGAEHGGWCDGGADSSGSEAFEEPAARDVAFGLAAWALGIP